MESLERIEMPQCEQLRLSKIEQLIIDIEEAINTAELFEANTHDIKREGWTIQKNLLQNALKKYKNV